MHPHMTFSLCAHSFLCVCVCTSCQKMVYANATASHTFTKTHVWLICVSYASVHYMYIYFKIYKHPPFASVTLAWPRAPRHLYLVMAGWRAVRICVWSDADDALGIFAIHIVKGMCSCSVLCSVFVLFPYSVPRIVY